MNYFFALMLIFYKEKLEFRDKITITILPEG